jgi:lipopolysaccharide export system permease protein
MRRILKKLDQLMVMNFLPPFIVTFFIALFVLVMQTLWLYIDEIAGKGVGFFLMVELLGYMSVSMMPLALPIAVLISSVMVLGNFAEHYELSSFKSAGVSLIRVMIPIMVIGTFITAFSFFCSNNLIPVSNLKFRSRLYDIRKQKPALNLEEGLFNDDFKGYSIRIGEKSADNKEIRDVLIIDHSDSHKGTLVEISADHGEMYVTQDDRYFVMKLYDGWQYQEGDVSEDGEGSYPFMRTHFNEWNKVFDLGEFQLERTDEQLFKSHHTMLTAGQLVLSIDSLDVTVQDRLDQLAVANFRYYSPYAIEDQSDVEEEAGESEEVAPEKDTETSAKDTTKKASILPKVPEAQKKKVPQAVNRYKDRQKPLEQDLEGDWREEGSLLYSFPTGFRKELISNAERYARTISSQLTNANKSLNRKREIRVKHIFELHNKFSMALACFIFLFIGAPMGAIVRKGGFGYPILISIGFFMLYMVLTIFSKNIAERFVIEATLAAWLPCLVLFPLGLILTFRAMNDSKSILPIGRWIARLRTPRKKANP